VGDDLPYPADVDDGDEVAVVDVRDIV